MLRIRELREQAGLTQTELADKASISRSLLNQLENQKLKSTTLDTLDKLAKALNVQISELFYAENV